MARVERTVRGIGTRIRGHNGCDAAAAAVDEVDTVDGCAKYARGRDPVRSPSSFHVSDQGAREDELASMESIGGGIWEHSISPPRHASYTPWGDQGTRDNKVSNDACTSAAPHLRCRLKSDFV
jgi:hypothetical protein